MSYYNDGIKNEYAFMKYLNGKKVYELNPLFYDLIKKLFKCNDSDIITCWKNDKLEKTDIYLSINGIIKGISIKMGSKNSVHVERITDFVHFLIECRIPRDIIIKYLEYHYADGTRNGKGLKRLSIEEYKTNHMQDIHAINEEFNNIKILEKVIERFVIKGINSETGIDALVYGNVNDFMWITSDEIRNIIISKHQIESTGVHFGCLSCQIKARNLNFNPKYEKSRFCVQIKWYSLFDDIIEYKNNQLLE